MEKNKFLGHGFQRYREVRPDTSPEFLKDEEELKSLAGDLAELLELTKEINEILSKGEENGQR